VRAPPRPPGRPPTGTQEHDTRRDLRSGDRLVSALPQSETARPLPLRESAFDRTSGFADYTLSGFANYKLSGFDRTATGN